MFYVVNVMNVFNLRIFKKIAVFEKYGCIDR